MVMLRGLGAMSLAVALTVPLAALPDAPPDMLPSQGATTLTAVLKAHSAALERMHVVRPRTLATRGTLDGLGLHGTFALWREADRERYDETLGIRTQRTLRLGDREYVQNENGGVRELHGLSARRQITEDFIDSGEFARHPDADELLGPARLRDGRDVWQIRVTPPRGEPYIVSLDARTALIDEKAFREADALETIDYSDYRSIDGFLYPELTVESNGDSSFDMTARATDVRVNAPIEAAVFAPFAPSVVELPSPVTTALIAGDGHLFVRVVADGHPLLFLLDTGSQGIFVDTSVAHRLGLVPEGTLEIRGARRTNGAGVAKLDRLDVGGAAVPIHVVSVVDLSAVTYRSETVDGVLGYPFFAAADVRIDTERLTMTIARPGELPTLGVALDLDTDRQLPELSARINDRIGGRFLLDTGNSTELLLFHAFLQAHPGVVFYGQASTFAQNRGVGGSSAAVPAVVDRLQLGPFNLYNRFADVMLASSGAFADQNEAGNIGLGTLKNFVFTFDLANRKVYLDKARSFDDGRYRPQYESSPLHIAPPDELRQ